MRVVREARTADELLSAVAEEAPDLAVVDIRMPPGGNAGLTAALDIRARTANACGCSSCRSTSSRSTRCDSSVRGPAGSATCSRTDSARRASSPMPPDASPRAARRSIRASSMSSSEHDASTDRLEPADPARAGDPRARRRGPIQPLDRRRPRRPPRTVEGAIAVIFSKLGLEEDARDNRRVLAVLAYLDGGG